MSRSLTTALIAALALGVASLSAEPASATPMAGASSIEAPVAATTEQVYFRRYGYGRPFFRRGYGYGRPFGYRRYGYGYRRGIPGHPIRRILRAL